MIEVSLCMIVKNEEQVLERCLDSYGPVVDEIIIVDTGSSDRTKEIARKYTDKVYDFAWVQDFSKARNFAFSKATKEYIFSADADEVLDEENRARFLHLKKVLFEGIEIVQMKYSNQLSFGTVYNFDEEYRPKLFKRNREFVWVDPIHETVRTMPVVFDSDIVITHKPHSSHAKRDFETFQYHIRKGEELSDHLADMYARELFFVGDEEDFAGATDFFLQLTKDVNCSQDRLHQACVVLVKAYRMAGEYEKMFQYAMKAMAMEECSETCLELGLYYQTKKDYDEAIIWFYNAGFETEPCMRLAAKTKDALTGLALCYEAMGNPEQAAEYRAMLQ